VTQPYSTASGPSSSIHVLRCKQSAVTTSVAGQELALPATLSTRQETPRKQTESLQRRERRMCAKWGCEQVQQGRSNHRIDHLVRASEHRRRNGEAECLRRFQIDGKLKFGRLDHR
jgi:hypothetical protein